MHSTCSGDGENQICSSHKQKIKGARTETIAASLSLGFDIERSGPELPPKEWQYFTLDDTASELSMARNLLEHPNGHQVVGTTLNDGCSLVVAVQPGSLTFNCSFDRSRI